MPLRPRLSLTVSLLPLLLSHSTIPVADLVHRFLTRAVPIICGLWRMIFDVFSNLTWRLDLQAKTHVYFPRLSTHTHHHSGRLTVQGFSLLLLHLFSTDGSPLTRRHQRNAIYDDGVSRHMTGENRLCLLDLGVSRIQDISDGVSG